MNRRLYLSVHHHHYFFFFCSSSIMFIIIIKLVVLVISEWITPSSQGLQVAQALIKLRQCRLLLKLSLIVDLTADLLLEYLVIE